jgi:hypothetical protein
VEAWRNWFAHTPHTSSRASQSYVSMGSGASAEVARWLHTLVEAGLACVVLQVHSRDGCGGW